jgi:hypothetical protein
MKKVVWFVFTMAVLLILIAPAYAGVSKTTIMNNQAIKGDEDPSNVPYIPTEPGLITQSPGDTAGMTHYDYQANGSVGQRIVVDGAGAVHMIWMRTEPSYASNNRAIWYNCWSNGSFSFPGGGTSASRKNRDGYCQLTLSSDNVAGEVFHNTAGNDSVFFGLDAFSCLGTFTFTKVPDRVSSKVYLWPYVTRSGMGDYQVAMPESTANRFVYTRSTDNGITWTALQVVDSIAALTPIVVASPVSNKVCMVWTRDLPKALVTHTTEVMYIQSADGRTWDFTNGKVNLTHYVGSHDSLAALYNVDAIYDYNDALHFEWYASAEWTDTLSYLTHLFHYNLATQTLSQIALSDSVFINNAPDNRTFGNYSWHFHDISLGVQQGTSNIYTTYTDYDTADVSSGGYPNGDIYMHYSTDNGATWSQRTNLTNSQTPLCDCGDCDADDWPTLAEKVDNFLHIEYINDKDAGAIPQSEGCDTDNPVLYLEVANPVGINDGNQVPRNFTLAQNYPNPFNSATSIDFELQNDSHVKLAVYDLTGGLIQVLNNGQLKAGQHSIIWKADGIPSGVYYYKLTTDKGSIAKKMTLLK